MSHPFLADPLSRVVADLLPLLRQLFAGRYAIAVAGSHGKKKNDPMSDIDLRAYYDQWISDAGQLAELKHEINRRIAAWKQQGVEIDGYWPRQIAAIDARLQAILDGTDPEPDPCVWTIWGYHLPTDLANNTIIEDPFAVIAGWQKQLQTYPDGLRANIIKKHLNRALYWRHDYHYKSKVIRQDTVFCAGLASLLVHDLIQVVFALNRAYYSGDGWNLTYMANFPILPPGLCAELETVLLVGDPAGFQAQHERLCQLIDTVEQLVKENS